MLVEPGRLAAGYRRDSEVQQNGEPAWKSSGSSSPSPAVHFLLYIAQWVWNSQNAQNPRSILLHQKNVMKKNLHKLATIISKSDWIIQWNCSIQKWFGFSCLFQHSFFLSQDNLALFAKFAEKNFVRWIFLKVLQRKLWSFRKQKYCWSQWKIFNQEKSYL